MRIGFFTDSYRPYTSGVVRSIDLYIREFEKRGHEVYIFGPDYPLSRAPREKNLFRFLSIPAPTMPDFSIPIPLSMHLGSTLERINLEVIHVHSPFLLGRLGAVAAQQHGLPLVFTFHTFYEQYAHYLPLAQQTIRTMAQALGREFCNRCDLVIAPSHPVEDYLLQIGVKARVEVIPTGVDLEEFRGIDRNRLRTCYGIGPDVRILLFVGRLGKEKNIAFLLRSFQCILELIPRLKLVIAGSGPREDHLRLLCADLGIEENVIFTGLLSRRRLAYCYAGADLFVFPSVSETQGLVIGEAKAAGLPVVAINASGASEMVAHGEDGLLVEGTPERFSEAVAVLLKDRSLYEKMRRYARLNALSISAASSAEKMLGCYGELLDSKPLSPIPH